MKLETGMKLARQLKELGGEKALALAILDELRIYDDNFDKFGYATAQKKLTNKARLILGLGFSEFLVPISQPHSDEELKHAAEKAEMLRILLEIDSKKLLDAIRGEY